MPTNQIVPFATGAGANVQTPAVYIASSAVQTGVQPGIADPQQANTSWRQASVVAAMIAQFICDHAAVDVLDDGNVATLETKFLAALNSLIPASAPATALWHVGTDTSTNANALATSVTPVVSTRIPDAAYLIFPAHDCAGAATINVGFGVEPLTRRDGTALQVGDYAASQPLIIIDDGTKLRILIGTPVTDTDIWHIGGSSGGPTAFTTTLSPIPAAATNGLCMRVYMSSANGASPTMNFGFGSKPIVLNSSGVALTGGEMTGWADMIYNGTSLELMNPVTISTAGITQLTNIFVSQGSSSDLALFSLGTSQGIARNVYSQIGVTGSNPAFGTISGGLFTASAVGKYILTGTLVTTSNQPSGELEYVVAYLYKNGVQITSALTANYSYGSSSTGLSVAAPAYLASGDTVQLVVFMHSQSNDDTSDLVVGGGATTLAIMKVG